MVRSSDDDDCFIELFEILFDDDFAGRERFKVVILSSSTEETDPFSSEWPLSRNEI